MKPKRAKYVRLPKPTMVRVELDRTDLRVLRAAIDVLKSAAEMTLTCWNTPIAEIAAITPTALKISNANDEWVRREEHALDGIEQRKRRSQ